MEKVDIVIIGAGIVGLSTACEVAGKNRDVILIERHDSFGEETSSRNSEVIHSGIYYSPGSLKARLCLEGNKLLYEICKENGIPCKGLGKLIVATDENEIKKLDTLLKNGSKNGIDNIIIMSAKEVLEIEPHINARAAVFIPSAGIIDSHCLMKYYQSKAKSSGVMITYGSEVKEIEKTSQGYRIGIQETNGSSFSFLTEILINSAGLSALNIAGLCGIDTEKADYHTYYYKGEYFRIGRGKHKLTNKLIYPFPPETGYVGIHTVPDIQGMVKLGPYNYFTETIDYGMDESNKEFCYNSVRTFLPFLELQDLEPDMTGIQPKVQKQGEQEKDFIIVHEEEKGFPGLINIIGIESPGLTPSPEIGRFVANMISGW